MSELLINYKRHISLFSLFSGGFPGGSVARNPPANTGDVGLIPGSGRSPREGNGTALQNSCLENTMDSPWGRKRVGQDLPTKQQQ